MTDVSTVDALPPQPEDWREPGAFAVAPGVHRIPLPLPDHELSAVNVYAIEDVTGLVLVDSGWALPDAERALADALRVLGHQPSDVRRVLATHAHHDHYTLSLVLRQKYGTKVSLGRDEGFTVDAYLDRENAPIVQVPLLRRCGAGALADVMGPLLSSELRAEDVPWGRPDRWLDDGDLIGLTDRALEVRATPGHTRGHVVLRDRVAGALFAGDHVLPHITPSIGFELAPAPAPLRDYLASLRLVRDLPDALLFPAHGPVTASVHVRVDELMEHHAQRLDASLAALKAGASTVFDVAGALTWTRRQRAYHQLAPHHAMLAVLETRAHLDVLVEADAAGLDASGEIDRYYAR